ncbi:hypothetical protein [Rhizobium anhuiense]|nr:hypothetical protein [Rhizobium anhuiense]
MIATGPFHEGASPELITAVGQIGIALNLIYMGVGHLDCRTILAVIGLGY